MKTTTKKKKARVGRLVVDGDRCPRYRETFTREELVAFVQRETDALICSDAVTARFRRTLKRVTQYKNAVKNLAWQTKRSEIDVVDSAISKYMTRMFGRSTR